MEFRTHQTNGSCYYDKESKFEVQTEVTSLDKMMSKDLGKGVTNFCISTG